ncbi:HEAT repeat-containing protein 3 [Ochlerotatus camptorhynchus]|uniref:HEAT repeat-containing protein 3 n=1 Tax=Ochlerotatus camptorhynchus TaxID=644619 RepID=UPI0031D61343
MGKAKKTRPHKAKLNPTGLVDVNALIDQELANGKSDSPIQAIVDQLQSASTEDKICGLQTLATICQNDVNIGSVVESDIVRIAASLLMDPDLSVRHATAGAFRNLSVQSVEICEYMVDQDVLTPLLALLNQYTSSAGEWKPTFDKTMQDQMDEKSDTFLQAVNLLWNLCESTSVALDSFNQSQLLESFVRCLDVSVYGKEIAVAVAQCLLVISEDNAASWRILSTFGNEISALLSQDGDNPSVLLRTVAAGIIANVPALSATYLSQLFLALSKTLEVNHRTALNSVTSSLPLLQQKDVADLEVIDDAQMEEESPEQSFQRRRRADMPSEVELDIRNVGWLLQAQRIAAEILTNICSTEEEEWQDDMDDDNLSEAESVHDYESNGANASVQNTDKLPVEALEAIKSLGLVEKLWQKAQPIAENVGQILVENDKNLLKRVNNLRASSMLCLHNLCNNISSDDLGGAEGIYQVWLELGQQVFQGHQNPKLLEASTSLMRATLEHLRKNPELFKQMTESDLQLMLNGVNECQDAEIRANWLRMLGILGCLLPEPLIKLIIDFVLTTSLKEQDIWTISEAMDSMMDIFADNDWNQVVHDLGMVAKCKELDRRMKAKLKQNKRELNERYPAVCTVRTNLSRFCKYLETEMKKFKPTIEA